MIEYAVKVGRDVVAHTFRTEAEARRSIREFKDADRAYDNPSPPSYCVVCRAVGPWTKVEEKAKK